MTVLTLWPGANTIDTMVGSGANATFNFGARNTIIGSATTKGLLKFVDLNTVPAGAICQSAILSLFQVATGAASAWTVTVYPILAGNTGWIEGTLNGVQALAGEPCWNAKQADGAGGVLVAWAGAAGLGTAGVDYGTALGTFSGNRSDANGTEYTLALPPATVQTWFGAVNQDYGMLLATSLILGGLGSSEHATAAWQPKLTVEYHRRYAPLRRLR